MLLHRFAIVLVAWSGECWAEPLEKAACLLQQSSSKQWQTLTQEKPPAEKEGAPGKKKNAPETAGQSGTKHDETKNVTATGGSSKDSQKKLAKEADGDGMSLRLELVLTMSLKQLQATDEGPLSELLKKLREEIVNAVNISPGRLNVLGVRGEYLGEKSSSLLESVEASLLRDDSLAGLEKDAAGQSIVDLEVLPGEDSSEESSSRVATKLEDQLASSGSKLMKGSLKDILQGAELRVSPGVRGLTPAAACPRSFRFLLLAVVSLTVCRFANL
jgi:hypothetical protein